MADKLSVEPRDDFGKGASRRLRATGRVPAVLYGREQEPIHLSLPGHETALAARNPNALLQLELGDGDSHLALIKDIQRHPLKRTLTHLDLLVVKRGEKVEVDIPVIVTGEPVAPAIAAVEAQTVTLLADVLNVPEQIEVDVEDAEDGFQVYAGDLTLPEGSELAVDAELYVLGVTTPRGEDPEEAEGEELEDAEAEGEESDEEE